MAEGLRRRCCCGCCGGGGGGGIEEERAARAVRVGRECWPSRGGGPGGRPPDRQLLCGGIERGLADRLARGSV